MPGCKSVLVLSDQHFPYAHPDIVQFLKSLNRKYKPDKVINIGDEVDGHSISFHDHDPDLLNPHDEFGLAIKRLKPLYEMFPDVDVVESNHGSLVYRKGISSGLPRRVLKSYREVLEAPKGWVWHDDIVVELSNGSEVYFCHGKTSAPLKLSQSMGMNTVQGHYHEKFSINYWSSPRGLFWDLRVGCLIDSKSLAFAYNKTNTYRPIIGCAVIIDGHPKLIPMILGKDKRWTGEMI